MSKKTDAEIKDLILTLDKKIDSLTQKVDLIDENIKKQDARLWGLILLILAACLGAILKGLNISN